LLDPLFCTSRVLMRAYTGAIDNMHVPIKLAIGISLLL
jgi:hypothetical protein